MRLLKTFGLVVVGSFLTLAQASLLHAPRQLMPEEISRLLERRAYGVHSVGSGFEFAFDYTVERGNEEAQVFIICRDEKLFASMPRDVADKFIWKDLNGSLYKVNCCSGSLPEWYLGSGAVEETTYLDARVIEKGNPSRFNIVELANYLKAHKVAYYSGEALVEELGISPYLLVQQLEAEQDLNSLEHAINYACQISRSPERYIELLRAYNNKVVSAAPTRAHWALAEITLLTDSCLMTTNIDRLHESTGIAPLYVNSRKVCNQQNGDELRLLDALITVGLSYDRCGFLTLYKQTHPAGQIIAISKSQPEFLGDEDIWLQGDVLQVVPALLEELRR